MDIDEKIIAIEAAKFLKPFFQTTKALSGSTYPALGLALMLMNNIIEVLTEKEHSIDEPNWVKMVVKSMIDKAHKYTQHLYTTLSFFAAILDPQVKVELIPKDFDVKDNLAAFQHHLESQYSTQQQDIHENEEYSGGSSSLNYAENIARKRC
ncbi:hypothetical protein BC936DRAFT_147273 [Jimgerdemannia flammicorona]|uniref:hAT-like transposase RNase-H fold domain-containing protein n=1 Tax=Jimgerdemannia flammicorona TaxID=994334 RepID=A0A433D5R8_9FUNG|nr:hypothetical protein BC936DRAFT_147273 [Jimgerdemannia flammicorona]